MILTDPNETVAPFHGRMPVILRPNEYDCWLSRDTSGPLPLDMLRTWLAEKTRAAATHVTLSCVSVLLFSNCTMEGDLPWVLY
jgi:putative SOS response-associated peptidase YedK